MRSAIGDHLPRSSVQPSSCIRKIEYREDVDPVPQRLRPVLCQERLLERELASTRRARPAAHRELTNGLTRAGSLPSMPAGEISRSQELAYAESAKVAAAFWDWRHRLMTFFFTGLVALTAVAGWTVDKHLPGRYLAAPLLLGGALSAVSVLLDRRIATTLQAAYEVGMKIEQDWDVACGIYSKLGTMRGARMSHILFRTYLLAAGVLLTAGVVDLALPIST